MRVDHRKINNVRRYQNIGGISFDTKHKPQGVDADSRDSPSIHPSAPDSEWVGEGGNEWVVERVGE